MEVPHTKALEIVGQQQIEIVVLRERVQMLSQHQCEPCGREHAEEEQPPE